METFFRDLRHSLRMFRQAPGFTAAAVAAVTLGIGANTAIFSVVNSVLLKPLPFPDPDRIVIFVNTSPNGAFDGGSVPRFIVWREQTSVVQDAAAYRFGVMNLTGGDSPEQLQSGQVTADFFRLFGAQTVAGRTFTADEDRPNGGKVAVLSHGFWQRRCGGDPGMVGRCRSGEIRTSWSGSWRRPSTPHTSIRFPTCGRRFRWIRPAPTRRIISPARPV
jgi:hypothetical protein